MDVAIHRAMPLSPVFDKEKKMRFTTAHIGLQLHATRALLKFLKDHRYDDPSIWLDCIENCLQHLEAGKVKKAYEDYRQVHLGKYGLNEWFAPVVYDDETEEYVSAVLAALCERWSTVMRYALIRQKPANKSKNQHKTSKRDQSPGNDGIE
jgi:hypothetical protein